MLQKYNGHYIKIRQIYHQQKTEDGIFTPIKVEVEGKVYTFIRSKDSIFIHLIVDEPLLLVTHYNGKKKEELVILKKIFMNNKGVMSIQIDNNDIEEWLAQKASRLKCVKDVILTLKDIETLNFKINYQTQ